MEPDGRYSHFELVSCKCVDTYVRVKQNQNQICWKWRKVSALRSELALQCVFCSMDFDLFGMLGNLGKQKGLFCD